MTEEKTVLSGPGGVGGGAPEAADVDAKVLAEAVRRGLITPAQGGAALEEARAGGVPVLEVLRRRSLLTEEAARVLDEEVKEDFVPGYRILSKLGEGGMGVVYRALQKRLDRVVALKVVMPHLAADPSYLRRFEREAKAVAKLNHPSIVAAYDYGESNGRVYLAMEFVEGRNLAEQIREEGPLSEDRALAVVRDAAAGLAHAHAAGILHRDVKPANILMAAPRPGETGGTTTTGAKVTDLGLARTGDSKGASELTAAGAILGTPGYMAPEQAFGRDIDQRADIYALGATLYQVLTGQRPFDASTPVAVIARQQTDLLRDPRDLRPGVSPGTVALLQGMLAREPESRYAGWKEVLADLDRVRRGEAPLQPLPPPAHRTIGAPLGGAPATREEIPRDTGTLISPPPESARAASTVGARAPAPPAAPPPAPPAAPRRSKAPLVAAGVLVLGGGAALAFVLSSGPGKDGEGRGGSPSPPTPAGAGRKDPAPPAAAEADPFPPELSRRFEEALVAGEDRRAVEAFLEGWDRYQALSPEGRNRHGDRMGPLLDALKRATALVERRFEALAGEGKYEEVEERLRWIRERMGERAPPGVEMNLARLASSRPKWEEERRAFEAAAKGREGNDPAAVLAALEGYEEKYAFSWRTAAAAKARAWAEGEMPLVTLDTDPTGARLVAGGRDLGAAPKTLRLKPGPLAVEAWREGAPPVKVTFEVERRPGQVLTLTLPPPDPEPAAELVPAGNPVPLWTGEGLEGWVFGGGGQWGASDPSRKVFLAGAEKAEPAALLRGAREVLGTLSRPLAPLLGDAPGWRLEWVMFGEKRADAPPARVEMHLGAAADGTALVLGIDGGGAYLGGRDAKGVLRKTHEAPAFAGGERHTFSVRCHGDVLTAEVDGKRLGAVAAPADAPADRTIRAAVEGGTGFFSDLLLQALRRP